MCREAPECRSPAQLPNSQNQTPRTLRLKINGGRIPTLDGPVKQYPSSVVLLVSFVYCSAKSTVLSHQLRDLDFVTSHQFAELLASLEELVYLPEWHLLRQPVASACDLSWRAPRQSRWSLPRSTAEPA